ncbi:NAD-dependent epimerase/dehydratase family protein [Rhodanobacter sp. AS-Z3]|uniref:NAD-dependent epimerase/dehydratase family protein n=1 Tax=Rhodanobacter sp. AS-Z3 TaxID=3031330 RepID=UPI002479FD84|nr:NAD-dependent epimerase/dehydratase family protein [Rhodanobacter sp. AS-Z3]WEN13562.1 NAD-dependent epimerase/dehydratase family protein [Rhodanobacter sp. AS-Z3]
MKVLLLGATGMVGQGALRECLLAEDVSEVLTLGRTPSGQQHPKLRELIHADLFDLDAIEGQLSGFDACFFCIGMTSAGMDEATYTRLTLDLTLAVAKMLARCNPRMSFVYISGAGADSSESSPTMWKRVRGRLENALQRLPFKAVFIFRPNIIQPLHGIRSRTVAYRWFYTLTRPLLPLLRALMPNSILSTEIVGRAMLAVVRDGAPKAVLEAADISAFGLPAASEG